MGFFDEIFVGFWAPKTGNHNYGGLMRLQWANGYDLNEGGFSIFYVSLLQGNWVNERNRNSWSWFLVMLDIRMTFRYLRISMDDFTCFISPFFWVMDNAWATADRWQPLYRWLLGFRWDFSRFDRLILVDVELEMEGHIIPSGNLA